MLRIWVNSLIHNLNALKMCVYSLHPKQPYHHNIPNSNFVRCIYIYLYMEDMQITKCIIWLDEVSIYEISDSEWILSESHLLRMDFRCSKGIHYIYIDFFFWSSQFEKHTHLMLVMGENNQR